LAVFSLFLQCFSTPAFLTHWHILYHTHTHTHTHTRLLPHLSSPGWAGKHTNLRVEKNATQVAKNSPHLKSTLVPGTVHLPRKRKGKLKWMRVRGVAGLAFNRVRPVCVILT
jgi:hypothetical protein